MISGLKQEEIDAFSGTRQYQIKEFASFRRLKTLMTSFPFPVLICQDRIFLALPFLILSITGGSAFVALPSLENNTLVITVKRLNPGVIS